MNQVNEGSTANLAISFYDEHKAAVAPTAAQYRIDDVASGDEITDWTDFDPSPSGATYDLKISAEENAIVNSALTVEQHRITIQYDYGSTDQGTAQIFFFVKNLAMVPLPVEVTP